MKTDISQDEYKVMKSTYDRNSSSRVPEETIKTNMNNKIIVELRILFLVVSPHGIKRSSLNLY